jgi:hypothetical protein
MMVPWTRAISKGGLNETTISPRFVLYECRLGGAPISRIHLACCPQSYIQPTVTAPHLDSTRSMSAAFGTIWFEVIGRPDAHQLVLEFPRKSASGEPLESLQQIIGCYWRKAHFGGRHLKFLCSECHRSARVLYARYANHRIWFFSCRKCAGVTYQSTMGHRWDRSARRVEKLRARLQWRVGGNVPVKPRAMHERTISVFWGCWPTTRPCESRGRATLEKIGQINIGLICGGNAETGLQDLADGHCVHHGCAP